MRRSLAGLTLLPLLFVACTVTGPTEEEVRRAASDEAGAYADERTAYANEGLTAAENSTCPDADWQADMAENPKCVWLAAFTGCFQGIMGEDDQLDLPPGGKLARTRDLAETECAPDGDETAISVASTAVREDPLDTCEFEAKMLRSAIELYIALEGAYPTSFEDLAAADVVGIDMYDYYDVNPNGSSSDTMILTPEGEAKGCPMP